MQFINCMYVRARVCIRVLNTKIRVISDAKIMIIWVNNSASLQDLHTELCSNDVLIIRSTAQAGNSGRIVVIMLTGQRVEVTCDPQKVTAGDLFQVNIFRNKYKKFFQVFYRYSYNDFFLSIIEITLYFLYVSTGITNMCVLTLLLQNGFPGHILQGDVGSDTHLVVGR